MRRFLLRTHLRGHLFLFEARPRPRYDAAAGARLLLAVLLLEGILGPRLWLLRLVGAPAPVPWIRVPALLAVAVILIRFFARLRPAHLGLRPWREWSGTERSYFLQVLVIANVAFGLVFAPRLRAVFAGRWAWTGALVVFLTSLLWGFYQELVYRGMLQTELVRRWGALPGILVANLLYTFGPLHLYHLSAGAPRALPMFAAIFAIGLFFAVLFRRSGNLVMVGLFHGLGDFYLTGLGALAR